MARSCNTEQLQIAGGLQMKLVCLLALGLLLVPVLGDQRDGSNAIGYLPPDPSLKTTDPFYLSQPEAAGQMALGYALPPIFGGAAPVPIVPEDWMNLSEHNEKLNDTVEKIVAANSYALTEWQMRDIPLGQENYL
jgi:hypothetical protein